MKKFFILTTLAVLSSTSLVEAVFDPFTATPDDFANKIAKRTMSLCNPGISADKSRKIFQEIDYLTNIAQLQFSSLSKEDQLKNLNIAEYRYMEYLRLKTKVRDLDDVSRSIKSLFIPGEYGANEGELTLNRIVSEKILNIDPLFYLKALHAEGLKERARQKDKDYPFDTEKVDKTYAVAEEYFKKEILPTYRTWFDVLKAQENLSYPAKTLFLFLDDMVNPEREQRHGFTPYGDFFIANEGLCQGVYTYDGASTEVGFKAEQFPLVMNQVSNKNINVKRENKFSIITDVGTGNYAFMSEPIPVKGFDKLVFGFKGNIIHGGCGIGLLKASDQTWVEGAFQAFTRTDENGGNFNTFIAVSSPPNEENVILTITNNQQQPGRSRFTINELTMISAKEGASKALAWKSPDSVFQRETQGSYKLVTDRNGAYQIIDQIPLGDTPSVQVSYALEVTKGAVSIGFLSQDQGKWLGNKSFPLGNHRGVLDIPTQDQKQVFFVIQNDQVGKDTSEVTVNDLNIVK